VPAAPVIQFDAKVSVPLPCAMRPRNVRESLAKEFAARLIRAGAVLTVPGPPACRKLVGDLRWEQEGRLLWFAAFGDKPTDAGYLDFDETHIIERCGIYFLKNGSVVGYLSTIEAAGVDDTEDYRMAWKFWEQVAPIRREFIERCYESFAFVAIQSRI
jgi:hypothetical protein